MDNHMEAAGLASRPVLQPPGDVTTRARVPPRAAAAATGPPPRPREDQVEEEVAFANALTEFLNYKVSFNYDKRIDQIVVTVTHGADKAVLRQFPSEEMIQLMVKFRRAFRGLIFHRTV
jgi:uncharacterized FlaG/YvyC family protein